jgi:uncharacterized protein
VAIACATLAVKALAATPKFPPLTGRVVDQAGVLDSATVERLTAMLAAHERATSEQVVVVTLDSLQGLPIEDFGYQLGRAWGIGQKGKNTGALLIVVPKDHKVRIEVGYGLEGQLTDAISRTIIESGIVPNFKRGDYNAGVLVGTAAIIKVLGGDPNAIVAQPAQSSHVDGTPISISALILIFVVFMLLRLTFGRRSRLNNRYGRYGGYYGGGFGGGGFGSGGFGGGGGGGGGFSGGGGSFGGGGASGSW